MSTETTTRPAGDVLGDLEQLANGLDLSVAALAADVAPADVVRLAARLRWVVGVLNVCADDLAAIAVGRAGDGTMVCDDDGVPLGQAKVTGSWKWEAERVADELMRRALDPEGTGELPGSAMEAAQAVRDAFMACAPISASAQWKVKGLDRYGVAYRRLRDWTVGKARIEFPRR